MVLERKNWFCAAADNNFCLGFASRIRMCKKCRQTAQMTVEFVVVLPIMIILAIIAQNALLFFSYCAEIDNVSREAIRIYAGSPSYGQTKAATCSLINNYLDEAIDSEFLDFEVSEESNLSGTQKFSVTASYSPNIFGMGVREEVLGVPLPRLRHTVALAVNKYNPGVIV